MYSTVYQQILIFICAKTLYKIKEQIHSKLNRKLMSFSTEYLPNDKNHRVSQSSLFSAKALRQIAHAYTEIAQSGPALKCHELSVKYFYRQPATAHISPQGEGGNCAKLMDQKKQTNFKLLGFLRLKMKRFTLCSQ